MNAKRLIYSIFILLLTILLVEAGFYLGVNANNLFPNFSLKNSQDDINNSIDYSIFTEPVKPEGTVFDPMAFRNNFNTDIASRAAEKGLLLKPVLSYSYRGILSKFIRDQAEKNKLGEEVITYYIILMNPKNNKTMTVGGGLMNELPDFKIFTNESGIIPASIKDLKIGDLVQYNIEIDQITGKVIKKELFILR